MMQKIKGFVKRNLVAVSFVMALSGFLNEIVFYIKSLETIQAEDWFYYVRAFSRVTDFSFLNTDFLSFNINSHSELSSSFFSLAFYVVFLLSLFLYRKSKAGETRLLRFSLSVVLISAITNILYSLFLLFVFRSVLELDFLLLMIAQILFHFLVFVICFNGLKVLGENRQFKRNVQPVNTASTRSNGLYAVFYHRIFHVLVDTVIVIFVFSNLIILLERRMPGEWFHFFNENIVHYFLMSVLIFGYYLFFETVFKATPAKFLTAMQVVSGNGEKSNFKSILIRTFSRKIPFDGLSFLGRTGWHDTISKTAVAREENFGLPAKKYFWIFPGLLLGGILLYGLVNYQIVHAEYNDRKETYQTKLDAINMMLEKGLTNSHYIQLTSSSYEKLDGFFSSDFKYYDDWSGAVYLKVEEVTPDAVTVSKIECNDSVYFFSFHQVDEYYRQSGTKFKKMHLSKDKINMMIHDDFDVYEEQGPFGIKLFNDDKNYFIENVVNFKEPFFEVNVGGDFSFDFENNADAFYLVAIEDIKAPVKFNIKNPVRVEKRIEVADKTSVESVYENYQPNTEGSFVLVLKIDLNSNRVFRYKVEKTLDNVKIKRIN